MIYCFYNLKKYKMCFLFCQKNIACSYHFVPAELTVHSLLPGRLLLMKNASAWRASLPCELETFHKFNHNINSNLVNSYLKYSLIII